MALRRRGWKAVAAAVPGWAVACAFFLTLQLIYYVLASGPVAFEPGPDKTIIVLDGSSLTGDDPPDMETLLQNPQAVLAFDGKGKRKPSDYEKARADYEKARAKAEARASGANPEPPPPLPPQPPPPLQPPSATPPAIAESAAPPSAVSSAASSAASPSATVPSPIRAAATPPEPLPLPPPQSPSSTAVASSAAAPAEPTGDAIELESTYVTHSRDVNDLAPSQDAAATAPLPDAAAAAAAAAATATAADATAAAAEVGRARRPTYVWAQNATHAFVTVSLSAEERLYAKATRDHASSPHASGGVAPLVTFGEKTVDLWLRTRVPTTGDGGGGGGGDGVQPQCIAAAAHGTRCALHDCSGESGESGGCATTTDVAAAAAAMGDGGAAAAVALSLSLYKPIEPSRCLYQLTSRGVQLYLVKRARAHWRRLLRSAAPDGKQGVDWTRWSHPDATRAEVAEERRRAFGEANSARAAEMGRLRPRFAALHTELQSAMTDGVALPPTRAEELVRLGEAILHHYRVSHHARAPMPALSCPRSHARAPMPAPQCPLAPPPPKQLLWPPSWPPLTPANWPAALRPTGPHPTDRPSHGSAPQAEREERAALLGDAPLPPAVDETQLERSLIHLREIERRGELAYDRNAPSWKEWRRRQREREQLD